MSFQQQYVTNVYDKIADRFSTTRAYLWRGVKEFILDLNSNSLILDAGCGNGKNMFRKDCSFIGIDSSQSMVDIVKGQNKTAIVADIRNIPFDDDYFDATISIAVIHHLDSFIKRKDAVDELIRVTKSGGKIFIQVWEDMVNKGKKFELIDENSTDYLVSWDNRDGKEYKRYYHLFKNGELEDLVDTTKVDIIDNFYECQNWCVVLKKKNK